MFTLANVQGVRWSGEAFLITAKNKPVISVKPDNLDKKYPDLEQAIPRLADSKPIEKWSFQPGLLKDLADAMTLHHEIKNVALHFHEGIRVANVWCPGSDLKAVGLIMPCIVEEWERSPAR